MPDTLRKRPLFHRVFRFIAFGGSAAFFLLPSIASSQQSGGTPSHFSGKTVTIIVGSAAGGGYDITARLVARFASKHLPGNPNFLVQNMAGGGQLRGLRATMKAKPDGLTVGTLHPRFVVSQLFGKDVPDFNLNTVTVIGAPSAVRRSRIWCTRRDLATSWQQILKLGRPVTVGANAPGGLAGTLGPEFVEALGQPIKMVFGYGGASEVLAAFDRRELDSNQYCTEEYVPRLYPDWIGKKILAPIFWWEAKPSDDWIGQLGSPMPPYVGDAIGATEAQRNGLEVAMGFGRMGRLFVAPPGMDKGIYQVWKSAFEATIRDPEFIKAADEGGVEVGLGTAEEFRQNNEAFKKLPASTKELVRKLAGIE
jgi:tripartite-type tricarboxylate transporter receptor subunit TctC